jgi:hypothetical protein
MMTDTMTFEEPLAAANESKTGRGPGQWTLAACRVWREAEPEASRLPEAALAWELATGRKATVTTRVQCAIGAGRWTRQRRGRKVPRQKNKPSAKK